MDVIDIKGKEFMFDALKHREEFRLLQERRFTRHTSRDVYEFDCKEQTGKYLGDTEPSSTAGHRTVTLPNILHFHEMRQGRRSRDKGLSDAMARKTLSRLGFGSLDAMRAHLDQALKLPKKRVPIEKFAPLNPYISYTIVMHVSYDVLELRNDDLGIRFIVAVPKTVLFTYEIDNYCKPAEWEAWIAQDQTRLHIHDFNYVPIHSGETRKMRRTSARTRESEAERDASELGSDRRDPETGWTPEGRLKDARGDLEFVNS